MWKPIENMTKAEISFELSQLKAIQKISTTITVDKVVNHQLDTSALQDSNLTIAANGALYYRTSGILPELMKKMYEERVIYKNKMIQAKKEYEKTKDPKLKKEIARCNNIQMAKKIALNSAYGSCGNQYFRYYKLENAEAITLSGQVAIRWIENKLNIYLNDLLKTENFDYVIASDTDSIYLNLSPLVNRMFSDKETPKDKIVTFLDKVSKAKLEPYIESSYQELADYLNAYEQKMQMKRENIADRGIWTAKKRYFLNVWDSEGVRYNEPKLKMMGIEAIKSSTPKFCRKKIKDAYLLLVNGTEQELVNFIEQTKKEFYVLPPEDVSFPRGISDLIKYQDHKNIYKKDVSVPMNARASLLYNHHVNKKGLTNKYPLIRNGDKIKYCYLKLPNPIKENVIGFVQRFPKELGLDKYVDYGVQFDKTFLQPLRPILDIIGWSEKETNTLDNFFL
jgi:DNA polymerase elongation subunit (family B)